MSVLARAELLLQAKSYSGSGDWLDENNDHDAQFGSTSGADTNDPLFVDEDIFYVRVTTTAPNQTLTLNSFGVSEQVTVDWGDGNTDDYTGTAQRTHQYASAATYFVSVANAAAITELDLRDSKLFVDSAGLSACTNINWLNLSPSGSGWRIDSSDFANMTPSTHMYLNFNQSGTYNIDSSDFANMTPSTNMYLQFTKSGTYNIDSADFANMTPSATMLLLFTQSGTYNIDSSDFANMTPSTTMLMQFTKSGTYNIDSADFANMTPSSYMNLQFTQSGTYNIDSADFANMTPSFNMTLRFHSGATVAVAAADLDSFDNLGGTFAFEAGLTEAQVDTVLEGLEDGLTTRTATGGDIDVAGNNAAPSAAGEASRTALLGDATNPWDTVDIN